MLLHTYMYSGSILVYSEAPKYTHGERNDCMCNNYYSLAIVLTIRLQNLVVHKPSSEVYIKLWPYA